MAAPIDLFDLSPGGCQAGWLVSSSSSEEALQVVDGTGPFCKFGPHYSRRTPGSATFTGCGQEIVLISACGRAVWSVVRQALPAPRGTGSSRKRTGQSASTEFVWRNNMFRNLGAGLSSELIRDAVDMTRELWARRYGCLPAERMRTEVDVRHASANPGYCYLKAGWERGPLRRHKRILYAPK